MQELEKGERMTDVCRQFGVSRKTGYKFLERWRVKGDAGLLDEDRTPQHVPHRTPIEVEELIVAARKEHRHWGARKLRDVLAAQHPGVHLPAASTIDLILRRHQLVVPRRKRRPVSPYAKALRQPTAPNDLWCADFKGQFRLGCGKYCYPLTISDQVSRYLLGCEGLESTEGGPAREAFEQVFGEHGLPWAIRTDNGTPFVGRGLLGLSRLSVWWLRLGIAHERIQPGHPEQNGRHERMHRTLKQETTRPAAQHLLSQQERFDTFRATYNEVRPHEALGQKPPSTVYGKSNRPYPERLPDPQYPLHDDVRIVGRSGNLSLGKGHGVFLTSALAGQPVGLRELDDGRWLVTFMDLDLGEIDPVTRRFEPVSPSESPPGAPSGGSAIGDLPRPQPEDPVLHG